MFLIGQSKKWLKASHSWLEKSMGRRVWQVQYLRSQRIGHDWMTNTFTFTYWHLFSSVHFRHSVVSNSLWPHGLQHARPSCPSPTPGVHPNPCPLSRWCHSTIPSSVVPCSSQLQSFPASGSSQMSKFFASGGQRIGISASASVLPMNV